MGFILIRLEISFGITSVLRAHLRFAAGLCGHCLSVAVVDLPVVGYSCVDSRAFLGAFLGAFLWPCRLAVFTEKV